MRRIVGTTHIHQRSGSRVIIELRCQIGTGYGIELGGERLVEFIDELRHEVKRRDLDLRGSSFTEWRTP